MRNFLMARDDLASPADRVRTYGLLIAALLAVMVSQSLLGPIGVLLVLPGVWAAVRILADRLSRAQVSILDPASGFLQRSGIVAALDTALQRSRVGRSKTAAIVLEINDFKLAEERFDRSGIEQMFTIVGQRLAEVLRDGDAVGRLDGPVFAVALSSVHRLNLDAVIQLCRRLQQALNQPISIGPSNLYMTCSIGFCLAERLEMPNGEKLLQAATTAMIEAGRSGSGAVRGYSAAMRSRIVLRNSLSAEVSRALDNGELRAFFQPQVSTTDHRLTGFEALARWDHPDRGLIPPVEFLPALQQAGLMERLGMQMVEQALKALRHWDGKGFRVPRVAVNFCADELRNPDLVERIRFQLDRFGLDPARLTVEVLETVVAGPAEDQVIRNLAGLSQIGCTLDLDDFGTGHASITNIRRFSIARIKIDRSFVMGITDDPDQQMMFSAILTMAERLELDTLAEGVETTAEYEMLKELGCRHVQGFGIARPMPFEETDSWITKNESDSVTTAERKTG